MSLFCTMPVLLFLKTYKPFLLKLWDFILAMVYFFVSAKYGTYSTPFSQTPLAYIIAGILLISGIIGFCSKQWFQMFIFHPYEFFKGKKWSTIITSSLIHSSWIHLMINVYFIYIVCSDLQLVLTDDFSYCTIITIILGVFFISIAGSNYIVGQTDKLDFKKTYLGASGGLFGLVCFACIYNPLDYGPPISSYLIFGWHHALFFVVVNGTLSFRNSRVNHKVHFVASCLGILLAIIIKPSILTILLNFAKTGYIPN